MTRNDVAQTRTQPQARIEARFTLASLAVVRLAAEIQEIIRLSVEGQRQIAALILNLPEPTGALKRAFQRRRQLSGAE